MLVVFNFVMLGLVMHKSFMLSVASKPIMLKLVRLNVVMLSLIVLISFILIATIKPNMLRTLTLSILMLKVTELSVPINQVMFMR